MIPTTNQRQQTILNALTAFPPGRIYLMASREKVALGFRLYHGKSVVSFGWNTSRSCLTAKVRGTRISAVNLFVNKESNAAFSCSSCGESSETRMCVHVICTLLTVRNLLQPELFRQAEPDEDYREMLLAGISGDPKKPVNRRTTREKPSKYVIRAEFGNNAEIDLKILRAGEAIPDNLLWTVPQLRELWLPPYAAQEHKQTALVRYLERWENRYPIIIKDGGKGLNLTRASYVFHLDPWWNPAVEDQASDRAHRIGQKRSVTITRVLMRHTIEEKMMELKQKKLALYKAVMESAEGAGKGFSITKEDFEFLLE